MSTLRERVRAQVAAHACALPPAPTEAPSAERLAAMRGAHGVMMEVTALLGLALESANVAWDELDFAATFEGGKMTVDVGGGPSSAEDDTAAARALSRALKEHDLVGVVEVVLP